MDTRYGYTIEHATDRPSEADFAGAAGELVEADQRADDAAVGARALEEKAHHRVPISHTFNGLIRV